MGIANVATSLTYLPENSVPFRLDILDLCLENMHLFLVLNLHGVEAILSLFKLVYQLLLQVDL